MIKTKNILSLFLCGLSIVLHANMKNEFMEIKPNKNGLVLFDSEGKAVGSFNGFWQRTKPKTRVQFADIDQGGNIKCNILEKGDIQSITAKATLKGRVCSFDFEVVTLKGTLNWGYLDLGMTAGKLQKVSRWVKHYPELNGATYMARDAYLIDSILKHNKLGEASKDNKVWLSVNNGYRPTHIRGSVTRPDPENKDIILTKFTYDFILTPKEYTALDVAAIRRDKKFSIDVKTDMVFNLYDANETPNIDINVRGLDPKATDYKLYLKAYDFYGKVVFEETKAVKNTGELENFKIALPASSKNNMYFLDSSVRNGDDESFTRTNIAIMPRYTLKYPEMSIIGISRNFNIPTKEEAFKLMQRINARLLRDYDSNYTKQYGILSFGHLGVPKGANSGFDPEKHSDYVKKEIDKAEKQGNPVVILGNEWGWKAPLAEKKKLLTWYVQWVKAYHDEIKKRGSKIKLSSFATTNENDMRVLMGQYKIGDYCDIIDLHPGRGCWTPDKTKIYWGYLELIERWRSSLAEGGIFGKDLIMTEAYSCTHQHNGFRDSFRQSAENMLLTLVIAYAQNAKGVFVYHLHEGTTWDQNGTNPVIGEGPHTEENAYGMLHADNSPKPSLMGFQAAAQHLDGVTFVQEGDIKGTKIHVYEFSKPDPKDNVLVMMDRTDGNELNRFNRHPTKKDEKGNPEAMHTEPWIPFWKSVKKHTFTSSEKQVRIIDSIGRETTIPVIDGKVELSLTGSPIIVYGVESPFHKTAKVQSELGALIFRQNAIWFYNNENYPLLKTSDRFVLGKVLIPVSATVQGNKLIVDFATEKNQSKIEAKGEYTISDNAVNIKLVFAKELMPRHKKVVLNSSPEIGVAIRYKAESENKLESWLNFYDHQKYIMTSNSILDDYDSNYFKVSCIPLDDNNYVTEISIKKVQD